MTGGRRSGLELISDIIKDIALLPGVSRVILYGSYAKGTQTRESDVDLAVFFDLEKDCLLDEYRKLVHICANPELDVQVQAFHDYELRDPCGIIEEIVAFGREMPLGLSA